MKVKVYEEFDGNQEIESICAKYGIEDYTINSDGSVDVQGNVDLRGYRMTKLPLEFGKVSGHFTCTGVGLNTLEGCPKEVSRGFSCAWNPNLTSLEGLENSIIRGVIYANNCENLYSLDGFPIDYRGKNFFCKETPIAPIYNWCIGGTYIEGTNQLAQAIQFFNRLRVIEEGFYKWEISYRRLLEYLKRYKEFGKPTKQELQALVLTKYIVR